MSSGPIESDRPVTRPKSSIHFPVAELRAWAPEPSVHAFSSYRARIENTEHDSMMIFAIRMAAGNCRGSTVPGQDEVHEVLRNIGAFYMRYSRSHDPLEETFAGKQLFNNRAETNNDQAVEAIWKRFEQHDAALERKLGLNVANAIYICSGLTSAVHHKMGGMTHPQPKKVTKKEYYDFQRFVRPTKEIADGWRKATTFTLPEILALFPEHLATKVEKCVRLLSAPFSAFPPIDDPLQRDFLFERPLVLFSDRYMIPVPHYLLYGLSRRLHEALSDDPQYRGQYHGKKGGILEEWSAEELRLMFGDAHIFRNTRYRDSSGKQVESDIIIGYEEFLIFVECTTKWVPAEAWSGNAVAIHQTMAASIKHCYGQALRAKRAYVDGRMPLKLGSSPTKLIIMVVTDSVYPNLMREFVQARRMHLETYIDGMVEEREYPYIISIYDLETLGRIAGPKKFLDFVEERIEMYNRPVFEAQDEFDYFILYSKPEYAELKRKAAEVGMIVSYVAHETPPVFKSPMFYSCLDLLGSDRFGIIKLGKKYSKQVAYTGFGVLYELYNSWEGDMHFAFSVEDYDKVIAHEAKLGRKCRALVWEGLWEYIRFQHALGKQSEVAEIERKLISGDIAKELGVLIVTPTDVLPIGTMPKAWLKKGDKTIPPEVKTLFGS